MTKYTVLLTLTVLPNLGQSLISCLLFILQKTLNIQDAPVMAMGMAAPAQAQVSSQLQLEFKIWIDFKKIYVMI